MKDETLEQISAKLSALLAFATKLPNSSENEGKRKPEEILAACGIKADEIASILGKNEGAVRKSLQRAGVRLR